MSNSAESLLAALARAAKHWQSWEVLKAGLPCMHGPCHVADPHLNFRTYRAHICQDAIAGCSQQSDKVTHQNSTQEFLQKIWVSLGPVSRESAKAARRRVQTPGALAGPSQPQEGQQDT